MMPIKSVAQSPAVSIPGGDYHLAAGVAEAPSAAHREVHLQLCWPVPGHPEPLRLPSPLPDSFLQHCGSFIRSRAGQPGDAEI